MRDTHRPFGRLMTLTFVGSSTFTRSPPVLRAAAAACSAASERLTRNHIGRFAIRLLQTHPADRLRSVGLASLHSSTAYLTTCEKELDMGHFSLTRPDPTHSYSYTPTNLNAYLLITFASVTDCLKNKRFIHECLIYTENNFSNFTKLCKLYNYTWRNILYNPQ